MIREAMLREGVVEAIIALPPRMRRETSAQIVVWIVRGSGDWGQQGAQVLFVDASNLGTRGKVETTLEEEDVQAIATIVEAWRLKREIARNERVPAVAARPSEIVNADFWLPFVATEPESQPSREELLLKAESLRTHVGDALKASLASTEKLMKLIGGKQ
jgi:type I restriction enzyme M protein